MRQMQRPMTTGLRSVYPRYEEHFLSSLSTIYTRECPILPVMVPSDMAFTLKDAIFYPKEDAKYGRYYVAPKGYFVGLKQNRLRNKHMFPYLVTCYMSNHMKRPNSDTYNYYINNADTIRPKRNYMENRMIPRSLIGMDQWYTRVGAGIHPGSFITALEKATCTVVDRSVSCMGATSCQIKSFGKRMTKISCILCEITLLIYQVH